MAEEPTGSGSDAAPWADALYRDLARRFPGVVYVDSSGRRPGTLFLAPQIEDLLGRPVEDYLADPELRRRQIHPDDRALVRERWRMARERGGAFECEYRMVRADGHTIRVRDSAVPFRGPEGEVRFWQGLLLDISRTGEAELALGRSEAEYRALVEDLPAVLYRVAPDDDRRTMYVSPHVETALGYSRDEWLGQPDIWMELLHPDDREPTLAAHDLHNETGDPWSREYRLIASDGRAVWFRDVAHLVRDRDGHPLYWQGVQLDITGLKHVEDELRAARDELERRVAERTAELEEANALMSLEIGERRRADRDRKEAEQRYRTLVEQIPAITFTELPGAAPDEMPFTYLSPQVETIAGVSAAELAADPGLFGRLIHPDDIELVLAANERCEQSGEPFDVEYRIVRPDGRVVWLHSRAVLVRDDDGSPLFWHGVALDVSAQRELESRFRELAGRVLDQLDPKAEQI